MRGLLRRRPEIDIVTVQDAGLSGIDDPSLLEWAAREGRILLTHDMTTMTHHAYERESVTDSPCSVYSRSVDGFPLEMRSKT